MFTRPPDFHGTGNRNAWNTLLIDNTGIIVSISFKSMIHMLEMMMLLIGGHVILQSLLNMYGL
jgi:hypothetical protein